MPLLLYIATTNAGKLRDFAAASGPLAKIIPLANLSTIPEPEETADTFQGNAILKALAFSLLAPGEIVLADDSGLEIPALHQEPGVRSARYAEDQLWPHPGTKDERNNACLLARTAHLTDRTARYQCVLAAARDGQVLATAAGTCKGTLLTAPQGTAGFGYDPLFLLPEHNRTMAQIDPQTRLTLSHRSRALIALLPKLQPHHKIAQTER